MNRYKVNIPIGKKGSAEIRKKITDKIIPNNTEPLEEYTMLFLNDAEHPIMSDSYMETLKHEEFFQKAKGNILIAGLGIGMCHKALMEKKEVKSVTIVEINKDVIDLVWDHCDKDERFSLINEDILKWIPPKNKKYDVGWFDISFENIQAGVFMENIKIKYKEICEEILFFQNKIRNIKHIRLPEK
jgi:hypothetical protein